METTVEYESAAWLAIEMRSPHIKIKSLQALRKQDRNSARVPAGIVSPFPALRLPLFALAVPIPFSLAGECPLPQSKGHKTCYVKGLSLRPRLERYFCSCLIAWYSRFLTIPAALNKTAKCRGHWHGCPLSGMKYATQGEVLGRNKGNARSQTRASPLRI
jgi:hypothetical protein